MSMTTEQKRKLNVAYDHAMSPHVALDHQHGTEEPPPPPTTYPTLQAAIDATPAGGTVNLTGQTFTAGAVIRKPLTLIGATVVGPQSAVYNSAQNGILVENVAGLTLEGCTIRRFGGEGIRVVGGSNLTIRNCTVEDIVYAGMMVISVVGGLIAGNRVSRIGVQGSGANSGNAYGIALTQMVASSPPTTDFIVEDNVVDGVPTWQGLDTHGGDRITWRRNTVRGCRDGIYITGWPAPARATDNIIEDNLVENTTGSNQYGITSVYSTGGAVRNNTIKGWLSGHAILQTSGGVAEATAVNLAVSGNVIS